MTRKHNYLMKIEWYAIPCSEEIKVNDVIDPRCEVLEQENEVGDGHVQKVVVGRAVEVVAERDEENDHDVAEQADDIDDEFKIHHDHVE